MAENCNVKKSNNNMIKNEIYYITDMRKCFEVKQYLLKPECRIINLSKNYYCSARTGEVFEKRKAENRSESYESIRRTMNNLRALINCNVKNNRNCLWVTLTYNQDNGIVRDSKKVYKDFKNYWGRFKTYCRNNKILEPKYISVLEPQGSGAWHLHIILIFNKAAPYIPNDVMCQLWGHGFTKTQALKDGDNIANYVCAYLTDYAYVDDRTNEKRIIKNARLSLYPSGVRYYRHSRNIEKPKQIVIKGREHYESFIEGYEKKYETNYIVRNEENKIVQAIHREQFSRNNKS